MLVTRRLIVNRSGERGYHPSVNDTRTPLIIGLAGGIGSGKSTVAAAFARRGFLVLDFDALAIAAIDRPEVRAKLVEWWGPNVIRGGAVDRGMVARIIFSDEHERLRLEGLIHPLVWRTRAEAVTLARSTRPPNGDREYRGVVMDAPVLFEAGLDTECDEVIFVECSRATRLKRVRASRGWDEAELVRREASQWPLDRKRAACGYVIHNDDADGGSISRLDEQVEQALATLSGRASGS